MSAKYSLCLALLWTFVLTLHVVSGPRGWYLLLLAPMCAYLIWSNVSEFVSRLQTDMKAEVKAARCRCEE